MSYLSIKNLTKSYEGNKVLNDITFDLKEGMFLSLLGPSGLQNHNLTNYCRFREAEEGEFW